VKSKPVKDVAASVRQRLLNEARASNRPFQEVLQYFAMERFLYRLSVSPHAKKFILKGALMFTVWRGPASRPTKDIDLLAKMDNSVDAIVPIVREICSTAVEPDGLVFDADSVSGEIIPKWINFLPAANLHDQPLFNLVPKAPA
jgi:Nucleotidyl transferase AbiEii toxin, Type IV TA system